MSRLVPSIPITLDRERNLKCDFAAVVLIQKYTGKNLLAAEFPVIKVTSKEENGKEVNGFTFPPDFLCGMLAALLTSDHEASGNSNGLIKPAMTPEFAATLIDGDNVSEVIGKCAIAIESFFPERKIQDSELPLALTTSQQT